MITDNCAVKKCRITAKKKKKIKFLRRKVLTTIFGTIAIFDNWLSSKRKKLCNWSFTRCSKKQKDQESKINITNLESIDFTKSCSRYWRKILYLKLRFFFFLLFLRSVIRPLNLHFKYPSYIHTCIYTSISRTTLFRRKCKLIFVFIGIWMLYTFQEYVYVAD